MFTRFVKPAVSLRVMTCGVIVASFFFTKVALAQPLDPVLRIPRTTFGGMVSKGGPRSAIVYDTCTGTVWGVTGGKLWRSVDGGTSFTNVDLPYGAKLMSSPSLYLNGCELVCQWHSKVFDNQFRIARYVDGLWSEVEVSEVTWPTLAPASAITDSLIFIDAPSGGGIDLWISWNSGGQWEHIKDPAIQSSTYEDYISIPAPGITALILKDSSAIEFVAATKTKRSNFLPPRTVRYMYTDKDHAISFQVYGRDSSSYSLSSDGGNSWQSFNRMNSSTDGRSIKGRRDSLHARWMHVRDNGSCTAILSSNLVVSTTDHGNTWIFNGAFPGLTFGSGMGRVSTTASGAVYCSAGGNLYALASEHDTVRLISANAPQFVSLCVIDSSNLIGLTSEACFYSVDGGSTWTPSSFSPAEAGSSPSFGVHDAYIERMVTDAGRILMYCPEMGCVMSYNGTSCQFDFSANLYSQPYFSCDDGKYSKTGSPLSELTTSTVSGIPVSFIAKYSRTVKAEEQSPGSVEGPHFFKTLASGEEFAFSDSLYKRSSDTSSWRATLAGLPTTSGRMTSASCLLQTHSGNLVAGFRGYQYQDGDSIRSIPGGLYLSSDQGMSWRLAGTDLEFNPYIWHVVETSDSILFASVSLVQSTIGNTQLYTSESALLRSLDDGATWQRMYVYNDLQRATTASGHRLASDTSGRIYALGDRMVVYSVNQGRSWSTLTQDFSPLCCLSDIVVDENSVVWVSSNEGLFRFDTPTTDLDEDDDRLRYTSVWAYPTPSSSYVQIRINNADLVDISLSTLRLYDLYGREQADLTPELRRASGSKRFEFEYVTSELGAGLYLLVLKDHNNRVEKHKLMISR